MRVLVLTPFLCAPPEHGGRIRSFHLLRALAQGHEVVNISGLGAHDHQKSAALLEQAGLTVQTVPLQPSFHNRSPLARLRKLWQLSRGRSASVARYRCPALARILRDRLSETWDLICLDQPWLAEHLPAQLPAPLVFASNNVESSVLRQRAERESSALGRALARLEAQNLEQVERALLTRSALTVAVSKADAQAFRIMQPESRVEVVDNGTDIAQQPLLWAPSFSPPRLLFVGGYDYPPNLDAARRLVLEVLPALREIYPQGEVQLAGRDPRGALADLARRPGVRVLGHVPALSPVYARSSALVVSMTFGGGSRLKILEAWAFGRPVVSSAAGAAGLDAQPGVHYLQAETGQEAAAAIRQLEQDPERTRALVQAGRQRVEERHDWPDLGRRFRELLEQVAGEAAP